MFVRFIVVLFYVDIDECTENKDNCHTNAVCKNTRGSYTCTCKDCFKGNGVTCTSQYVSAVGGE